MVEQTVGFLDESEGNRSSMRLFCFISLIASICFGLLTLLNEATNASIGLYMTMGFLLAAFAPKALQKFMEEKLPVK